MSLFLSRGARHGAGLIAVALWASCALAEVPPRLDPAAALARELAQGVAAGSTAALINFIARHPDAPLTAEARVRLAALPADDGGTGSDAAIHATFDAARLAGTRAALAAFARRYPSHPLAAEAAWAFWLRAGGSARP
jgi:hypothetical protein